LTPEERQLLRDGIDESYKDFVTKVANARRRSFAEIEPLAQGRVWLGSQAKANGLVDELGGLDAAIAQVKKKANIPAGENVSVLLYPARRSLIDLLMKKLGLTSDELANETQPIEGELPPEDTNVGGPALPSDTPSSLDAWGDLPGDTPPPATPAEA